MAAGYTVLPPPAQNTGGGVEQPNGTAPRKRTSEAKDRVSRAARWPRAPRVEGTPEEHHGGSRGQPKDGGHAESGPRESRGVLRTSWHPTAARRPRASGTPARCKPRPTGWSSASPAAQGHAGQGVRPCAARRRPLAGRDHALQQHRRPEGAWPFRASAALAPPEAGGPRVGRLDFPPAPAVSSRWVAIAPPRHEAAGQRPRQTPVYASIWAKKTTTSAVESSRHPGGSPSGPAPPPPASSALDPRSAPAPTPVGLQARASPPQGR